MNIKTKTPRKKADPKKADPKKAAPAGPREAFIERCLDILGWDDYTRKYYAKTGYKIAVEWTVGGQSGGSCWDDGEATHYAIDTEPEPEFDDLDKLLEQIFPAISYLQYKVLNRELVVVTEKHENDYYGNYTNYQRKTVDLGDLYDYLEKKGWLNRTPTVETATADLNGLLAALGASTVSEALDKIKRD